MADFPTASDEMTMCCFCIQLGIDVATSLRILPSWIQTEQKMKAIFGGRDGITFFLHDSNLIYINLHYSLFRMPFFDYVVIF